MLDWVEAMTHDGGLSEGRDGYSSEVRAELLAMSAATIDRYLASSKTRDVSPDGDFEEPGHLLRALCGAYEPMDGEPGFFRVDVIAHCGPTPTGDFAQTVNLTDMHIGWVSAYTVFNTTADHLVVAFDHAISRIPYMVVSLDIDDELVDDRVIAWAGERGVILAHGGQLWTAGDVVVNGSGQARPARRYGFRRRRDTAIELALLQRLWPLVGDRLNYFTPKKKPVGWAGRRRLYDRPTTPYQRLVTAGVLSPAQQVELASYKASLSPTRIAEDIHAIQRDLATSDSRVRSDAAFAAGSPSTPSC